MFPHLIELRGVQGADHPARFIGRAGGQNPILGEAAIGGGEDRRLAAIDVERRAPGREAHGRGAGDVALVLDRAGGGGDADSRGAMRAVGAGRRQHQPGAGLDLGADMLREFDIVADGNPDPAPWRVEDTGRRAGGNTPAFSLEAGHDALLLHRHAAIGGDQRRAGDHARAVLHRQRAGQQPDLVADRGGAHRGQDGLRMGDHGGEFGGLVGRVPAGERGAELDAGIFGQDQKIGMIAGLQDPMVQLGAEGGDGGDAFDRILQQAEPQRAGGRRGHGPRSLIQKSSACGVSCVAPTSFQAKVTARPGRGV